MIDAGQTPNRRVGFISDTHGLLRQQVLTVFAGCELILHAGDIGEISVLDRLSEIAPVCAVRGNVDRDGATRSIPLTEVVAFAGHTFYMLHNLDDLDLDPAAAGFSAVVYGHSHQPTISKCDGVLYFNPGSAGPKRFSLPISVGIIEIGEAGLEPSLVPISA